MISRRFLVIALGLLAALALGGLEPAAAGEQQRYQMRVSGMT